MAADRIRYGLEALNDDAWRRTTDFSPDIRTVHDILIHDPYAADKNREEALNLWVQRFQPCLFGRVAAALGRVHYCFLSDADLALGEEWVSKKIGRERRLWKTRAIDPNSSGLAAAHSFVLHVASARIARAAPDNALRSLALLIRELWGCQVERDAEGNDVARETLYLRSPDGRYMRFLVNLDFFAAQGDGRWWHDHRIPGGFAFTANATGHMARYREWYEAKPDQGRWTLNTAMGTIAAARETSWGKATALLPVENGRSFVDRPCPFELHPTVKDKDWTRYRGYFDTDHSVRNEFFALQPERPPTPDERHWLQDLTYIYDPASPDHSALMAGETATAEEIERDIGPIESWRKRPGRLRHSWLEQLTKGTAGAIGKVRSARIRASLAVCRSWALSTDELAGLDPP
jgi:hypothetical protein